MENNVTIPDQNNEQPVSINGSPPLSMKVIQSIYHEMTGKTEELSKTLSDNHIIEYEDLDNLNTKIEQLEEQYSIVSKKM